MLPELIEIELGAELEFTVPISPLGLLTVQLAGAYTPVKPLEFAIAFKLAGFSLLAYLIFNYKMDGFWLGMLLFFVSSAATILFYLLARTRSIR